MTEVSKHISLADIIERFGCEVVVPVLRREELSFLSVDPENAAKIVFQGIAPLSHSAAEFLSFLANPRYLEQAKSSSAGAILCSKSDAELLQTDCKAILLVSANPYACFARISQFFFRPVHHFAGQSERSSIDSTAAVAADAVIFPFVFVGSGARIESGAVLYPGSFVGAGSIIGKNCILYPNCVVQEGCELGDGCIINPGAVIGGEGFGFAPDGDENVKIPQLGGVKLGRNVEIGANSSVDCGTLSDTEVGDETKIDSLVQVAHNVKIGKACFLAGQSGIAGSARLGDRVSLGGQVAVVGHLQLADGVIVMGKAGVSKNLEKAGLYNGVPAVSNREYLKHEAVLRRLVKREIAKSVEIDKGKRGSDL